MCYSIQSYQKSAFIYFAAQQLSSILSRILCGTVCHSSTTAASCSLPKFIPQCATTSQPNKKYFIAAGSQPASGRSCSSWATTFSSPAACKCEFVAGSILRGTSDFLIYFSVVVNGISSGWPFYSRSTYRLIVWSYNLVLAAGSKGITERHYDFHIFSGPS